MKSSKLAKLVVSSIAGILVRNTSGDVSAAQSGTDVKTINGNSILGSGDMVISSMNKTDPDFMRLQRRMRDI